MNRIFFGLIAILATVSLFSLSACGKVSRTEPIVDSGYPHTYPRTTPNPHSGVINHGRK